MNFNHLLRKFWTPQSPCKTQTLETFSYTTTEAQALEIVAQRGFQQDFLEHFRRVSDTALPADER